MKFDTEENFYSIQLKNCTLIVGTLEGTKKPSLFMEKGNSLTKLGTFLGHRTASMFLNALGVEVADE